mgnify:CR=1 FL=1
MDYITSFVFGHPVYWLEEEQKWRYTDNDELIDGAPPRRCPKCNKFATSEDHDPCIENLPGVSHACCGHGVDESYVKFTNGVTLYGVFGHMVKEE